MNSDNNNHPPSSKKNSSVSSKEILKDFRYLNNIVRNNDNLRLRIKALKKRIGQLNYAKARLDGVLVDMTKQMGWQVAKLKDSFAVTPVGQTKICLLNWLSTHNKDGVECPCGDCDFTRDLIKKIDSYYTVE